MRLDLCRPYRITQTGMGDFMLYNPNDQFVGRSFDLYGQFSMGELAFLLAGTEEGHTVVDVGANIGAFTVPLAKRAKRVVAIEAQRLVHQMLCANIALNGLTNVLAIHAGAGNVAGQTLTVPLLDPFETHNFGALSADGDGEGEPVPCIVLDDLPIDECHLIKIDVEGMERQVIQGASRLIARHKPALYIENDRAEKSASLIAAVLDLGYRAYWHLPPLFSPKNPRGNAENVFPNLISINMICWPEDKVPEFAAQIEHNRIAGPEDTWQRFRQVPKVAA